MAELPQHSRDAEEAVAAAVLLSPIALEDVREIIDPSHFFIDQTRTVFAAVCELTDRGTKVDTITVAQHLNDRDRLQQAGGTPYLAHLINATPAVANVVEHAKIIQSLYRVRQIGACMERASVQARAGVGSDPDHVQRWIEDIEAQIADVAHGRRTTALRPLREVAAVAHAEILRAKQEGTTTGISTGFTDLDKVLAGWHRQEMTVIAARPGMGKTAFALSVCMRVAATGHGVVIFSLEQPAVQLALRVLASEAQLDIKRLREGTVSSDDLAKLTRALATVEKLPVFIDDSPGLTPLEIRGRVKKLQREIAANKYPEVAQQQVGLVAVDYLQLQHATGGPSRNREADVASMARENKETCKLLDVTMLLLSQLNREVEKRRGDHRPQLSDLRESGAIEQDADNVIFLLRPAYYDPDDPKLRGYAEAIVAKQRHGPTSVVKLAFAERCARFENFADAPHASSVGDLGDEFDGDF